MGVTYSIVLGKVNKNGLAKLYIRHYYNGKQKHIPTEYRVKVADFNENATHGAWVKKTNVNYAVINSGLLRELNSMQFGKSSDRTFRKVYDEYVSRFTTENNKGIIAKYKTFITQFEEQYPNLLIKDIDIEFINKYRNWLASKNYATNTIAHKLKRLRAIVKYAKTCRYITVDDFEHFSIKQVPAKKDYLSRNELEAIKKLELTGWPERARDVFVFCVYSMGMRIGDALNLKPNMITGVRLSYKMGKSKDLVNIDLLPEALAIATKYKGGSFVFDFGPPATAAAMLNKALKTVAIKAGIQKRLTTHVARHTWTNLAISADLNINEIKAALGHSSLATTQAYVGSINDKQLNEANKRVFS